MKSETSEQGDKIHGDKLEPTHAENQEPASPPQSAIDQLSIPPHEQARTDGGSKIHGDKLDPHSSKDKG